MNQIITILIADDHPVFRKGLRDIIAEDPDLTIVREVGEGDRVVDSIHELGPDVLLLDLNMPRKNGLEIASSLRDEKHPVKIIILTLHKEEGIFNKAMDAGVQGYILKEAAARDIIEGIKAVAHEQYYISPMISHYLVRRRKGSTALREERPGLDALSDTERKILKLVSENYTSKDIAEQLFISIRTV